MNVIPVRTKCAPGAYQALIDALLLLIMLMLLLVVGGGGSGGGCVVVVVVVVVLSLCVLIPDFGSIFVLGFGFWILLYSGRADSGPTRPAEKINIFISGIIDRQNIPRRPELGTQQYPLHTWYQTYRSKIKSSSTAVVDVQQVADSRWSTLNGTLPANPHSHPSP